MYKIFLKHNRPWAIIEVIIFVILFSIVTLILGIKVRKKKLLISQAIAVEILFVFMAIVLASTVFTRTPNNTREYCLIPFWSWWKMLLGNKELLKEILPNIFLFVPEGFLLPFVFHKKVFKRNAFVISFFISMFIEICQLIFCVGFFEWDDMLHNATGATIACALANKIFEKLVRSGYI